MSPRLLGLAALPALLLAAAVRPPPPADCAAARPADLQGPARWLGPCLGGRADGAGVLRVGAAAPFGFFVGRMTGGGRGRESCCGPTA